jgi:hypothetical protein
VGQLDILNFLQQELPPTMTLTDVKIRNAAPGEKSKKLFDGNGLYLEVSPSGGKWWRMKYRFSGKEKRISLGVYPSITLADARERRSHAHKQLANDIDPSENRKAEKLARVNRAANTFESVTREWFAKRAPGWADVYSGRLISRFEQHVFPWLGERPIAAIEPHEVLAVVRRIASSEKIVELVERGGGFPDQKSRMELKQDIEKGRGGVFLNLTAEQYGKLKRLR